MPTYNVKSQIVSCIRYTTTTIQEELGRGERSKFCYMRKMRKIVRDFGRERQSQDFFAGGKCENSYFVDAVM